MNAAKSSPYRPVSCGFHEELEMSVMRRHSLVLTCDGEAGDFQGKILPLDVYTRDGAEWLRCRKTGGGEAVFRLDHILSAIANP
jgi:Rho-binding antiterminator